MVWVPYCSGAWAEDWPTYNHDYRRSAVTSEKLHPEALELAWVYELTNPTRRAMSKPAPGDYWRSATASLKDRMNFDMAAFVVVVGDRVYFASFEGDAVYCLDRLTGEENWVFITGGPVRMAPTVANGKVYIGSDDGLAYCLDAEDGSLIWTYRPGPSDHQVPSNGKYISLWAIRSGVVVDGGIAYFAAGFIPQEKVYICAVDAETGADSGGEGLWKRRAGGSLQGYMLASADYLFMPGLRNAPYRFNRSDGNVSGRFNQGRGVYALLTEQGEFVNAPADRFKGISTFNLQSREHLAHFDGNHLVVTASTSYLHRDASLTALNRNAFRATVLERSNLQSRQKAIASELKEYDPTDDSAYCRKLNTDLMKVNDELQANRQTLTSSVLWNIPCKYPLSLILTKDYLFVGGDREVAAIDIEDGSIDWTAPVQGRAFGLTAANEFLFVTTDTGSIYAFQDPANRAGHWTRY